MELDLVLNELSCAEPAADREEARRLAEEFLLTVREATQAGARRVVRSTIDLQKLELATGYRWWNWLADTSVDLELRRFFRLLETKHPALLDAAELAEDLRAADYFCQEARADGLGIAHRMDALAVSMLTAGCWDSPFLTIQVEEIQGDGIEVHEDKIPHASRPTHVSVTHRKWIKRRLESLVDNGAELWRRREQFFGSLAFCRSVAEQMTLLPQSILPRVLRGLFHLNDYARNWNAGGFECELIECRVSPESPSTMEQFGSERMFACPDGSVRAFSWHAKVGEWRIYFDPADGPGQLLIGYVGKHLRTKRFR